MSTANSILNFIHDYIKLLYKLKKKTVISNNFFIKLDISDKLWN